MPRSEPPLRYRATPARHVLRAGTMLWRVHDARYGAGSYNPRASRVLYGGSRFDGTERDPYQYLYAAPQMSTSLAESLLRGLAFDHRGSRTIRRVNVRNRVICPIVTTADLHLASMTGSPELAAICQDEWLIQAGEADFPQTRDWAHWIRRQADWAQGLIWLSKRDLPRHAVVLFADRCPGDALRPEPDRAIRLDDAEGAAWLNGVLASYRVCIRSPRAKPA